jgi:hypothetical protein
MSVFGHCEWSVWMVMNCVDYCEWLLLSLCVVIPTVNGEGCFFTKSKVGDCGHILVIPTVTVSGQYLTELVNFT